MSGPAQRRAEDEARRAPVAGDQPDALVARLRDVHLAMVDAVLTGDGLQRVAELAAESAGGAVAIVVPRLRTVAVAPAGALRRGELAELSRYVADRLVDRPVPVPERLLAEVPIAAGDEQLGAVALLGGGSEGADVADARAREFLHLAAVASLTEVAVEEAREEAEENLRGSLLEELRDGRDLDTDDIVRRARRLGCELAHGAVVLCAELSTERPRHVVATIASEHPGALAEALERRVYALLPALSAAGDAETGAATVAAARRLAERLRRHGTVGVSSFYARAGELRRAVQEAELVLEVLSASDAPIAEDIGTGTYRLLFRVLASHPEEVRSFYADTVEPIVAYDRQYSSDLVGTLDTYLRQNCNMNATAATIFAHRHTVAYRLDRVRELTGLDPLLAEDRERLGLGLKAYRIIAPRLPR